MHNRQFLKFPESGPTRDKTNFVGLPLQNRPLRCSLFSQAIACGVLILTPSLSHPRATRSQHAGPSTRRYRMSQHIRSCFLHRHMLGAIHCPSSLNFMIVVHRDLRWLSGHITWRAFVSPLAVVFSAEQPRGPILVLWPVLSSHTIDTITPQICILNMHCILPSTWNPHMMHTRSHLPLQERGHRWAEPNLGIRSY